jgi:Hydrolase of X-linked nucleoside diphosphate N terminal/NUDIX domain
MEPAWLDWARRLNALAQSGLAYAESPYDIERYTAIRTVAAEMIAQGSGADTSRVLELFACDAGYATPKVDVRGVVFQDSKILLVQERSDGMWTLPGGWADVGDSPADAVVREIRERNPVTRPVPRSCSPSSTVTATITRLMSTTSTRSSSGARSSAAPRQRATTSRALASLRRTESPRCHSPGPCLLRSLGCSSTTDNPICLPTLTECNFLTDRAA